MAKGKGKVGGKVTSGQQHRGGSGANFTAQARHTSGKKNKKKKAGNHQKVNKYANLAELHLTKPKADHPQGWMNDCRCKNNGTCTFCVNERKAQQGRVTAKRPPVVDSRRIDTFDDYLRKQRDRDRVMRDTYGISW